MRVSVRTILAIGRGGSGSCELTQAFRELITHFQKETDALFIDQVNNPGGSVFYRYALASILSDYPLTMTQHRLRLTQAGFVDAKTKG